MIQDENGNPRLRSRQVFLDVARASTSVQTRPMLGAASGPQTQPDGTSTVTTTGILANGNIQTTTNSYSNLSSSVSRVSDALGRTLASTK